MPGTVVFVHGIGVRQESYDAALRLIAPRVRDLPGGFTVASCAWGTVHGAALGADGRSIPAYDMTRAPDLAEPDAAAESVALWSMLELDPLYELRVLGARSQVRPAATPGAQPKERMSQRLRALTPEDRPTLASALQTISGFHDFGPARDSVVNSLAYTHALDKAAEPLGQLRAAVARAVTAATFVRMGMPLSAPRRDAVVNAVIDELGGLERGLFDFMAQRAAYLAMRSWGTGLLQARRGKYTDTTVPFAGDILLYQARGAHIRGFIETQIRGAGAPVVVLAHSLGGIACVDLLIQNPSLHVDLLVTVGSQAPFLYEIDALVSLPFGEPMPQHFRTRWLNIFNRRDFLSYVGKDVIPGAQITDVEVTSDDPFPLAHSAYWTLDSTWAAIRSALPRVLT